MRYDKNYVSANDGDNLQEKILKILLKMKEIMTNIMWMFCH